MALLDNPISTKTPVLTELCVMSDLSQADLINIEHPVNIKAKSGKRTGMAVMTSVGIHVATGSNPDSPWSLVTPQIDIYRPAFATIAITQMDIDTAEPNTITITTPHPSGTDVMNPPSGPVAIDALEAAFLGYKRVTTFTKEGSNLEIVVDGNGDFVLPTDGVYLVPIGWGGFRHSHNNSTIAFVLVVLRDGFYYFSQRPTSSYQPNLGKIQNVAGGGKIDGKAGDILSVWVASDVAGTVTLGNGNLTAHRLIDTTVY